MRARWKRAPTTPLPNLAWSFSPKHLHILQQGIPMKKTTKTAHLTRRTLLKTGAALALAPVAYAPGTPAFAAQPARHSVYEALGLRHVINATGTVTNLGGSIMPPE